MSTTQNPTINILTINKITDIIIIKVTTEVSKVPKEFDDQILPTTKIHNNIITTETTITEIFIIEHSIIQCIQKNGIKNNTSSLDKDINFQPPRPDNKHRQTNFNSQKKNSKISHNAESIHSKNHQKF